MSNREYKHLIKTLNFKDTGGGEYITTLEGLDLEGLDVSFSWGYQRNTGLLLYDEGTTHLHPYGEVLMFTSLDYNEHDKLGASIDININGQCKTVDMPAFIAIPAGMPHGPIITQYVERPFGFLAVSCSSVRKMRTEAVPQTHNNDDKLVRSFKMHDMRRPGSGNADYMNAWSGHEINGFKLNFTWAFHSGVGPFHTHDPHVHPNDECLVFLSLDPDNPYDLGAEIEIDMGTEMEPYVFNTPCAVIAPAGLVHCPLIVKKVNRPWGFTAICLNNDHDTTWLGGDPGIPNLYALPPRQPLDKI